MRSFLFILFSSDLPDAIGSYVYCLYCDDMKTLSAASIQCLKADIDSSSSWSRINGLSFHPSNWKIMSFGCPMSNTLILNETELKVVSE